MKKKIYLLLLAFPLIVGCGKSNINYKRNKESHKDVGFSDEVYIVEVDSHKYVIFNGYYKGGIVHAESCRCKEKNKNK